MSDSGTKRPPNSPNRPSGPGCPIVGPLCPPVVAPELTDRSASRRGTARSPRRPGAPPPRPRRHGGPPLTKASSLCGSFFPGARSTPVDTSTPNGCRWTMAASTLSASRPPDDEQAPVGRPRPRPAASRTPRPSPGWSRRSGGTRQPNSSKRLMAGLPGAERLDGARDPCRDPLAVLDRLVPVELHRPEADGVGDLDDPAAATRRGTPRP